MSRPASPIHAPRLDLAACSVDEHCEALVRLRRLPMFWWNGTGRFFGNYSLPFRDASGRWWYQPHPGLAWPVEVYRPADAAGVRLPYAKSFLGWQHLVADESAANSRLVFTTVLDLPAYGPASLDTKRRNTIRRGLAHCRIQRLTRPDLEVFAASYRVWRDLTARVGYRHSATERNLGETWRMLLDCPGVSILVAREAQSGEVAGFLILRLIGDTACFDALASRTDLMATNVNSALMYAGLANAARLPGVRRAFGALRWNRATLEYFKRDLGFAALAFPACTRLRPGIGPIMRLLAREKHALITGTYEERLDGDGRSSRPP
jgi:hypothetical protein